jgi:hypothetical protein
MPEPFVASVQYDDLHGTVAFDGHDGSPLHELAKYTDMPNGYFPVGISLHQFIPNDDGKIHFRIVAIDARKLTYSMDGMLKATKDSAEIAVYPFDGMILPADLMKHFKRFDLKAINKNFADRNVQVYGKP